MAESFFAVADVVVLSGAGVLTALDVLATLAGFSASFAALTAFVAFFAFVATETLASAVASAIAVGRHLRGASQRAGRDDARASVPSVRRHPADAYRRKWRPGCGDRARAGVG